MTVLELDLFRPRPEPERDGRGRPLVVPPEGGDPVPYTRCTTAIDCLEDKTNIDGYHQRMVAAGLGAREDLWLMAAAKGLEPHPSTPAHQRKKWRDEMNALCEEAQEAGGASRKANTGTALHEFTERMDAGLSLGPVPSEWQEHLRAYESATASFEPTKIETFSVEDDLRIGGTPDRVLKINGGSYIGDLKTGNVSWGLGKMAMQLAVYAHSETHERSPLAPDMDLSRGVIIALDATTARCHLIWLDLAAGWEAVQLATKVRAWRARTDLVLADATQEAALEVEQARDLTQEAAASLRSAIAAAGSPDELISLWRSAGNVWTAEFSELAAHRKAELIAGAAGWVAQVEL
jgi:hypothetical protein